MMLSLGLSINNSKSFYCGDRFGGITVLEVSLYFVASFFLVFYCYCVFVLHFQDFILLQ